MSDAYLEYVCGVFDWIESNSGRNDKIRGLRLLKESGSHVDIPAQTLLSIAYDWYRHYYIGKLPTTIEQTSDTGTLSTFVELISKLETGKYRSVGLSMVMETLSSFPPNVSKWLRRCILKDLRMGVSHISINNVWDGLIRTYECQLAADLEDPDALNYPVLVEPKIDGVRGMIIMTDEGTQVLSRGGKPINNVEHIVEELAFYHNARYTGKPMVYDGEFFVDSPHATLKVTSATVNRPDEDLLNRIKFYAFDIIPKEHWDSQSGWQKQEARTAVLRSLIMPQSTVVEGFVIPSAPEFWIAENPQELERLYIHCLEAGYEGVMVKNLDAKYSFKRTSNWLKYKPFEVDIFEVSGYYEGDGRLENSLGGIEIVIPNLGTNKVGGGFTDALRAELWSSKETLSGRKVRVKYKNYTPDGFLREPVFLSFVE